MLPCQTGRNSAEAVSGMAYGLSFILIFVFISHAGAQEDKIGALQFLSLPITIGQIVGAKFLVLYILGAVSLIFGFLLTYSLQLAGKLQVSIPYFFNEVLPSVVPVLVVGNIVLWASFRFGSEKMARGMVIMAIFLVAVFGSLVTATKRYGLSMATTLPAYAIWGFIFLLTLAVLLFCFLDSIRALQKRDM